MNSRNKGCGYERKLMNEWKDIGFENCMTSRNGSKYRDDQGVDLLNTGEWNVQAKAYKSFGGGKIIKTLKAMPKEDNINIVQLKIDAVGERGEIVCMMKEDFYKVLKKYKKDLQLE